MNGALPKPRRKRTLRELKDLSLSRSVKKEPKSGLNTSKSKRLEMLNMPLRKLSVMKREP